MKKLLFILAIVMAGQLFAQAPPPPGPPPGAIMPEFPGGEAAYQKYLQDSIRYPQDEKQRGISGTVYVSFIVNTNGKISNAKVETGIPNGPGLDAEALRVIAAMPDWKPASYQGSAAKVSVTQPVKFVLSAGVAPAGVEVVQTGVPQTEMDTTEPVYAFAEVMPQFPGGETAFQEYLKKNMQYPEAERANKKEGTVYLNFTVSKDGSIRDVVVMRGVKDAPGLSAEAVRVISAMPKWSPGIMNGKQVNVSMTVPISFRL